MRIGSRVIELIELRVSVWTQHQPSGIGYGWTLQMTEVAVVGVGNSATFGRSVSFGIIHSAHLCHLFVSLHLHSYCSSPALFNQLLCQDQSPSPALGDCQTPSSKERRANVPSHQAFSTYRHWDYQACSFFRDNLHYPCHRSLLVRLLRYFVCHWSC